MVARHSINQSQLTCMLYARLSDGCTMTLTPDLTNFRTWCGANGARLSQTLIVSLRMAMTGCLSNCCTRRPESRPEDKHRTPMDNACRPCRDLYISSCILRVVLGSGKVLSVESLHWAQLIPMVNLWHNRVTVPVTNLQTLCPSLDSLNLSQFKANTQKCLSQLLS
jgi:hypothetical protein